MPSTQETYPVDLAGLKRELPLFEVKPGLRIAILNILGDTELVQACARALAAALAAFCLAISWSRQRQKASPSPMPWRWRWESPTSS